MKKNFLTLAFLLMFASTTAFADGEIGHGNRTPEPIPPAGSTSNQTASANSSDTLLNQLLNIIYAITA